MIRIALVTVVTAGAALAGVGGLESLPAFQTRADVVQNGSFESGSSSPANWTLSSWVWASGGCRTGSRCISLSNQGSSAASAIQTVNSVTFRSVRVRFWMRTTGTGLSGAAAAYVALDCASDTNYGINSGHTQEFNLGGGVADWTQYTLSENLTWGSIHYGHNIRVKIHGKNIPASATLYVDDVTAEPVIVPLTIFPLYPNYRGMLWSDQGLTMKWRAVVETPDGESISGLKVDTELLDAAKTTVLTTITTATLAAVDITGGLGAKMPGASWQNIQTYDASGLPDGVYYLRGKLKRKADGATLYTYPDYKIVKEQPSVQRDGWNTWVDKYNRARIKPFGQGTATPRFIHGTFLNPVYACNGSSGAALTTADGYRSINIGNSRTAPQITPWNRATGMNGGTVLKVMADVRMNADIFFGNLAGGNIGIVNTTGTGTISTSGTAVTGSGTLFVTHFSVGDVIEVSGIAGPGTVSSYGRKVIGNGTSFTASPQIDDEINIAGTSRNVGKIVSDTELWAPDDFGSDQSGQAYTVTARRRVESITDDTHLTVDAAFPENLAGVSWKRNLCTGFNSAYSNLLPWLQAEQDFDIWHLHITVSFHPLSASFPVWSKRCKLNHTQAIQKLLGHNLGAAGALGKQPGWLGTYIADEPPPGDWTKGMAVSFDKARAAMDATDPASGKSFGAINYWVDGLMPVQTWNQWGNFMDASGPDPYPWGMGALGDDVAYGVGAGGGEPRAGRNYWWPRQVADGQFDSRPLWPTIQLFRVSVGWGLPSANERKQQIVSALAAGATGIFWWELAGATGFGCVANDSIYLGWQKDAKVIADLMPLLEEPVQDLAGRLDGESEYGRLIASVSDPAVKCVSRGNASKILLACANTTNVSKTVTIAATSPIPGTVVRAWDGSVIAPSGSSFSDTFTGLLDPGAPENSVHVYLWDREPAAMSIRPAR